MKRLTFILLLLTFTITSIGWAEEEIKPLALGASAPDFNLPGVDGKNHKLSDYADADILVIIFTCNHCPTAQAYEERIKQLVNDYKEKGVTIIAISPNDPKSLRLNEMGYTDLGDTLKDCIIRAKHHEFNFSYLYDGDTQEASKAYGPRSTPHVFIFNKELKLVYGGGIDDSEDLKKIKKHYVRSALDALLAGQPIVDNDTPTKGCSIKWADKRDSVVEYNEKLAEEKATISEIDLAGAQNLLQNDSDKLRFINFWASWCPPCRAEFPDLIEINRMYRNRNFEMITISIDDVEKKQDALNFLNDHNASTTNYIYNGSIEALSKATNKLFMGSVPFTMVIKPGGEIVFKKLGSIDALETKQAIVDVLGRTY